jgi:multicomponent Na+:H+ antiporter subunit D
MTEHLAVLQVVVPLLAAPLCLFLRHRRVVPVFATLVAWATLAIAVVNLVTVTRSGEALTYYLGGWAPPLGIELRIDTANAMLAVLVSGIASVVLPYGPGSASLAVPISRHYLYYAAFLLCMTGLIGISITGDAFNVFVFLEVTSLSSYTLIAMGKGRKALTAAFSYLIMGTIGGTFILLSIGLLYQMTGTLNMADLAERLDDVRHTRTVLVAFGFMVVGASIKLAVFPLHQWLPNAYTYAPSSVSAFLSGTATKVTYYLLVRSIFTLFGAAFIFGQLHLEWLLLPLSIAAMFVGSVAAIQQTNVKRLLAYSSIAQIGYMTLGLSLNSVQGLAGGLVHLFNHGLMKGGLFLVVANVTMRLHSNRIEDMAGLGKRMPVTMLAWVIGGLSLIGVPGTAGFVSKWYLVQGALDQGLWWVAVLILLSSLLAVGYVWKVVEVAYLRDPPPGTTVREAPLAQLIPTWILIGGTIVFGLWTEWTGDVAMQAAQQLMGIQ